jgi:hypothetical protein
MMATISPLWQKDRKYVYNYFKLCHYNFLQNCFTFSEKLTWMMEAVSSSEVLVSVNQTTWHNIPADSNL